MIKRVPEWIWLLIIALFAAFSCLCLWAVLELIVEGKL